eukprot:scaffold1482_cov120-Cylindrotheca_fusiformis.AAC.12
MIKSNSHKTEFTTSSLTTHIMRKCCCFALLWTAGVSCHPSSLVSTAFVSSGAIQPYHISSSSITNNSAMRNMFSHSSPIRLTATRKGGYSGHSMGMKYRTTIAAIRGGSSDFDSAPEKVNYGGIVAGLFGNLRIPASLVAGASLGSAFALPLAPRDGLKLGTVKRLYALFMMGSLAGMLLTVLVSTMCMNDIALSPPRYADNANDYIKENYALEWMAAKSSFMWGSIVFVLGSMLRMWVFLTCPVFANGVVGIMTSLTLVSISILLEFTRRQTGQNLMQQTAESIEIVKTKIQKNHLFGVAVVMWMTTLLYLAIRTPHFLSYLVATKPGS